MSVRVWSLCWRVPVGGNTKLVLLRLADFANDTGGSIFPTIATVAEDCGISERTVQYCLRELEEGKYIVPSRGPKTGRGYVTSYRIDMNRVNETIRPVKEWEQTENIEINKGANSAPFDAPMGAKNDQMGADFAEKGATVAPNPSLTVKNPPPPETAMPSRMNGGGGGSEIREIVAGFDRLLVTKFGEKARRQFLARSDEETAAAWLSRAEGSVAIVLDAVEAQMSRETGKPPGSLARYCNSVPQEIDDLLKPATLTAGARSRNGEQAAASTAGFYVEQVWLKVYQDALTNGYPDVAAKIEALATTDIPQANDVARSMREYVSRKKERAAA